MEASRIWAWEGMLIWGVIYYLSKHTVRGLFSVLSRQKKDQLCLQEGVTHQKENTRRQVLGSAEGHALVSGQGHSHFLKQPDTSWRVYTQIRANLCFYNLSLRLSS